MLSSMLKSTLKKLNKATQINIVVFTRNIQEQHLLMKEMLHKLLSHANFNLVMHQLKKESN